MRQEKLEQRRRLLKPQNFTSLAVAAPAKVGSAGRSSEVGSALCRLLACRCRERPLTESAHAHSTKFGSLWCASQPRIAELWDTQAVFGAALSHANRTTKSCPCLLDESEATCSASGHIVCRVRGGWSGRDPTHRRPRAAGRDCRGRWTQGASRPRHGRQPLPCRRSMHPGRPAGRQDDRAWRRLVQGDGPHAGRPGPCCRWHVDAGGRHTRANCQRDRRIRSLHLQFSGRPVGLPVDRVHSERA
ncbi:hypothetical protein NB709_000773 [Xanthomonas sacchari]|nr:hypothetical protein [Xanthomonas sacchari]